MKMTKSKVIVPVIRCFPRYCLALGMLFFFHSAFAMVEMKDEQLADVTGQALLQMGKTDGQGAYSDVTFYKAGLDAALELNMNIENLQLGCTADDFGTGQNCDIDIRNFSLSGLPSAFSTDPNTSGSPDYSLDGGRPATSAMLTRPFFEFAINNDDSKTLREVVGIRLGAESMLGMLSTGLENNTTPSASDGIQSLSGYMQIAGTTGEVNTAQTTFGANSVNCVPLSGVSNCQSLGGKVDTILGQRWFRSLPTDGDTSGITVPSLNVGFDLPAFTVTGKRLTEAVAENVTANIPWLPIAPAGDCPAAYAAECAAANAQIAGVDFSDDLLRVLLTETGNSTTWEDDCLRVFFCVVSNSNFAMADGSAITDLDLNITFKQALSMFHNIPLEGTGFYLSLQQKETLRWPGANADDIAQKGWWMSFAEPVQLGYLEAQQEVDVSDVLPQVAASVTNSLLAGDPIDVSGLGDSWTAITNGILRKQLQISVAGQTASLTLENQQLKSQHVTPNCWGSSTFC